MGYIDNYEYESKSLEKIMKTNNYFCDLDFTIKFNETNG